MITFDLYPVIVKLVIEDVVYFTIGHNFRDQGYHSIKTISRRYLIWQASGHGLYKNIHWHS